MSALKVGSRLGGRHVKQIILCHMQTGLRQHALQDFYNEYVLVRRFRLLKALS